VSHSDNSLIHFIEILVDSTDRDRLTFQKKLIRLKMFNDSKLQTAIFAKPHDKKHTKKKHTKPLWII